MRKLWIDLRTHLLKDSYSIPIKHSMDLYHINMGILQHWNTKQIYLFGLECGVIPTRIQQYSYTLWTKHFSWIRQDSCNNSSGIQ